MDNDNTNLKELRELQDLLITFMKIWDAALSGNYIKVISGELTATARNIAKFPKEMEKDLSSEEKILFEYAKTFAYVKEHIGKS